LYLDTYENQLLASQENSMIQQGRILSAALTGADINAESRRILENLALRVDSRIRVVNARGELLADSATVAVPGAVSGDGPQPGEYAGDPRAAYSVGGGGGNSADVAGSGGDGETSPNARLLYRLAVYPINGIKKLVFPPQAAYSTGEYYSGQRVLLGPEIRAALDGRYGAATRFSSGGQVSVNLYSAIPIPGETPGEIGGAVLVSRSSYGILLNLYRIRLDIIKIFLVSLGVSLLLSLGLSFTITRPIKKLREEAERVLDREGHFSGHFRGLKRRDEIGDLSRSLSALSLRLEKRIGYIDTFTSDLLHELKNPLAAIRGQTELSLASPQKEEKLLLGIRQEETRIERFLSRLRELSRLDNLPEAQETKRVDLSRFLPLLLERYPPGGPNPVLVFNNRAGGAAFVRVNPDRLVQVLTNPLDNAVSFSPPGGTITVELRRGEAGGLRGWLITIDDEGPGIREEEAGRYFERFYTERPQEEKENHSGLGLAIVRAICQGYGGFCALENRRAEGSGQRSGGCRFILVLPAAKGQDGT
jgi:two-component system sensor histidine kinase ChvG